jgi:hypothetical protein
MKAIQFRGKIVNGKAQVYQPELMQMYIESLKKDTSKESNEANIN